jgi:hypothetical protein
MIVKIHIKGDRALVTPQPDSKLPPFEESAARLRCRFAEQGEELIGFFEGKTSTIGESRDSSLRPVTARVFEVGNRIWPKETW